MKKCIIMTNVKDRAEAQRFIKNMSGNTKFSISKNSRAIGLSRQTYQNKLDGLRDQKIITNFTININPDIRPNNLKYVMLGVLHQSIQKKDILNCGMHRLINYISPDLLEWIC